jgi:hypothetical protein
MRGSMRAATAIGVGYLLGRRRKLGTAALLAAATAVGGKSVGGLVLQRGIKMLGSMEAFSKLAPQLGDITDTVRDELLTAGKAAATAAVSNRIDSLTNSIHDRAERLRNPGDVVAGGAEEATEAAGTAGRAASSGARRATSAAGGAGSAGRRATGRGRPDARDQDDRDQDQDYDEADDLADRDRDDYRDRREPDDYEGEPDDYDDEPDETRGPDDYDEPDDTRGPDDEDAEPNGDRAGGRAGQRTGRAPAASGRRGDTQRRTPVSRARR